MASASFENKKRTVVPRWRDSTTTLETQEIASFGLHRPRLLDHTQFREKVSDFATAKSVTTASELLASAIVLDQRDVAREAAEYLATYKGSLQQALIDAAKSLLEPNWEREQLVLGPTFLSRERIRRLKACLNEYPRDAVGWVDVAREYANLGQIEHAIRAMNVAISLAPNSRLVLRAAACLFVHAHIPDRAHYILLRADATPEDPWLIAAELAVAPIAKVEPEFVREARFMLKAANDAPIHLNEMVSALATLEMTTGNNKTARKLFHRALHEPTENTIAQINWAAQT